MSNPSTGAAEPGCTFCSIVAGDIPSAKVYEDERTYAFMDIAPASDGHVIVVPKNHTRDLLTIGPDELSAVVLTGQKIAQRLTDVLFADGVNLLNNRGERAWQTVFHFHLHVIPRYLDEAKDRLSLPWVPTPGDLDEIRATGKMLAF
jgi:histidine triad (HIT) family protein